MIGVFPDSHGSQEKFSSEKGKLPSPHLWFHSPERKWLPGIWWGGLLHRGSRKYGQLQAGMCPGHRAGRVQSHLQNIDQVGTKLWGQMSLGKQGPPGRAFPMSLQMRSDSGQVCHPGLTSAPTSGRETLSCPAADPEEMVCECLMLTHKAAQHSAKQPRVDCKVWSRPGYVPGLGLHSSAEAPREKGRRFSTLESIW